MLRRLLALTLTVATVAATSLRAQSPVSGTVQTSGTFTAITGIGAGGYIGSATITGATLPGSGPFQIFCTDKNNSITLGGSAFAAWITPLWGGDVTRTRLGGDNNPSLAGIQPLTANALAIYRSNASLAAQLPTASAAFRATLQDQIWQNAEAPFNHALFGNANFNATGWYVITQVSAVGNDHVGVQELLAFRPVPEPSTYAMMGTGLALLVLAARRRRAA
ncbi:MAG: PEP-CTERM sorting domain-containing protein [Gemmatimonadaceae bacterium]|jgi:hypothetical protein|nr:PEP-CTERM sorting domain-containing protein [Gemmatimonadaceae bacterium]